MKLSSKVVQTEDQKAFNELIHQLFDILNKVFVYTLSLALVIQGGHAILMQIGMIYKIIYKFRYIEINMPENVRGVYVDSVKLSFSEDASASQMSFIDQGKIPQQLNMYSVSAYFLENFGGYMWQIFLLVMVGLLFKLAKHVIVIKIQQKTLATEGKADQLKLVKIQQLVIIFGYIYQGFVWNFTIAVGMQYYLDAMFFCFLTAAYPPTVMGKQSLTIAMFTLVFLIC